jgi:hypothetical protein
MEIRRFAWRGATSIGDLAPGRAPRLGGGCHYNRDLHCRVWWRYGIESDAHDGCIGFRVVLAER